MRRSVSIRGGRPPLSSRAIADCVVPDELGEVGLGKPALLPAIRDLTGDLARTASPPRRLRAAREFLHGLTHISIMLYIAIVRYVLSIRSTWWSSQCSWSGPAPRGADEGAAPALMLVVLYPASRSRSPPSRVDAVPLDRDARASGRLVARAHLAEHRSAPRGGGVTMRLAPATSRLCFWSPGLPWPRAGCFWSISRPSDRMASGSRSRSSFSPC